MPPGNGFLYQTLKAKYFLKYTILNYPDTHSTEAGFPWKS